jgi:hypothetical protein
VSDAIDTPAYAGRAVIHFHAAKHYYTVSVPSLGKARVYQPGVTSILKLMDKSGPLCWWTAEQCQLYALDKIGDYCFDATTDSVPVNYIEKVLADMRYHYRDVAREAANVGTIVHDYLHRHLSHVAFKGPPPERPTASLWLTGDLAAQANHAIDAGLEFFATHKMEPLTMEQPVWSATYGYVGTDDFIGRVDGELCTCDYKTSKNLYPEVWLQTAAYQAAYQEEYPETEIKARWGINVGKDGELYAEHRGGELFDADFKAFLGLLEAWRWNRVYGSKPKEQIEIIGALPHVGWLEAMAA